MDTRYENKQQLADRLGVSCRTINTWMTDHRIPFTKITERVVRFIPQEVDQALVRFAVRVREPRTAS